MKYTDPDGKETRKGVHLNLLPKNEEHYFYANDKILQNDKYYVAAHGNPKAIYEYLNASEEATSRGKSRPISPEELVERIKSDPNYSEGMTVVI